MGTYNFQNVRSFDLPQAIYAIKQGTYDLMLLTERKIPDAVYCLNLPGYDIVCSKATVTTAGEF